VIKSDEFLEIYLDTRHEVIDKKKQNVGKGYWYNYVTKDF